MDLSAVWDKVQAVFSVFGKLGVVADKRQLFG